MPRCAASSIACKNGGQVMAESAVAHAVPVAGSVLRRGLVIPCGLLAAWAVVSHAGWVNPHLLVPPDRVLLAPFVNEEAANLWSALGASLLRMVVGFAAGTVLGGTLGILMGLSRTANRIVGPSFTAIRQITLFAWIPLLTAWFGNGETAKFVFIALAALFPMALNTQQGVRNVPVAFREVARVLRLSRLRTLTRVLLPSALPSLFIGLEIALINAWIGTVGAEYAMGFGRGIGTFLAAGREQFRMDIVILGVLALALVGYLMNALARVALRTFVVGRGGGE
jgi:sulfonate transport system permease protein